MECPPANVGKKPVVERDQQDEELYQHLDASAWSRWNNVKLVKPLLAVKVRDVVLEQRRMGVLGSVAVDDETLVKLLDRITSQPKATTKVVRKRNPMDSDSDIDLGE